MTLQSFPSPDRWDDWREWDPRHWPRKVERRYLLWALETFHGSRGELSTKLGVAERTLFRKLRELKSHAPAGAA